VIDYKRFIEIQDIDPGKLCLLSVNRKSSDQLSVYSDPLKAIQALVYCHFEDQPFHRKLQ
jgi:hypothetical protein